MDLQQYNAIPTTFATAKEIGLAPQTLAAYARRGMVESTNTTPKMYRRIDNSAAKVYEFLTANRNKYKQYFTLHKYGEQLGMMCSLVGGEVVDCWGKKYDLTGVVTIEIKGKIYKI
jgi:hypothetical protein